MKSGHGKKTVGREASVSCQAAASAPNAADYADGDERRIRARVRRQRNRMNEESRPSGVRAIKTKGCKNDWRWRGRAPMGLSFTRFPQTFPMVRAKVGRCERAAGHQQRVGTTKMPFGPLAPKWICATSALCVFSTLCLSLPASTLAADSVLSHSSYILLYNTG